MNKLTLVLPVLLLLGLSACDSFVEDVDAPINDVLDTELTTADQVPFLINGVQARFATAHDFNSLTADLLSDQAVFGRNSDATFPTYLRVDLGIPRRDNNSVDGAFNLLGQYRLLADTLIQRISGIDETEEGFSDPGTRNEALFIANFHGGIARYFYAAYYGLAPQQGGGVIGNSAFIPTDEMYQRADDKLATALDLAGGDDYRVRLVNSIRARIAIFRPNPDYDAARSFAENGLQMGDAPFQSLHSIQSSNEWWSNAGRGRSQVVAADRFRDYVQENPQEGYVLPPGAEARPQSNERLKLRLIPFARAEDGSLISEPQQDLYPNQDSPIDFITWQANSLIQAELDIRAGDFSAATDDIDAVRNSHGLDSLSMDFDDDGMSSDTTEASTIQQQLIEERDKELFAQGIRLVDQRRFSNDSDFPLGLYESEGGHLQAGTWRYLPITAQECNANENIDCPTVNL